jgi:site-specific recombinase XerD
MTKLRQRMDAALVLRGFALRTRETYLACVAGLAKHYRCSPDRLNAEQIQAYLLHLITEKKLAYASVNQVACACRFLFGQVLQQRKIWLDIPMAKVPKRLPVVLAREDINRLFAACGNLRTRTVLMTTTPPACASPKSAPCN